MARYNAGGSDPGGEDDGPIGDVRGTITEIEMAVEETYADELAALDDHWPFSVEFVSEADQEVAWFDVEPPEGDVPNDVEAFRDAVATACADLRSALDALAGIDDIDEESDDEGVNEQLLRLITATESLHGATIEFDARLSTANTVFSLQNQVTNAFKSVKNWLTKNLLPTIKGAAKKVWKLIQNFTNLKQWSVGGGLGATVLGLTGSANVTLTFD